MLRINKSIFKNNQNDSFQSFMIGPMSKKSSPKWIWTVDIVNVRKEISFEKWKNSRTFQWIEIIVDCCKLHLRKLSFLLLCNNSRKFLQNFIRVSMIFQYFTFYSKIRISSSSSSKSTYRFWSYCLHSLFRQKTITWHGNAWKDGSSVGNFTWIYFCKGERIETMVIWA